MECDIAAGIARVWLARPERRNALHQPLLDELGTLLRKLDADPAVRVIVLGGRGKAFCAGADLQWMSKAVNYDRQQNLEDAGGIARLLQQMDAYTTPVIARVHGACYAGATGLVAACDIAVAADDARFCFSEVKIGLVPATIAPYVLRAMGYRAAMQHMLTAEPFDASMALRSGLISEVVALDQLDLRIDALARMLVNAGSRALGETRMLLRQLVGRPIDANVTKLTIECIADARVSPEGIEGMRAVLAGESPRWRQQ
ncbi:MAG: enoyl-CoA hydratase/isomerase family protein [Sinobacteraceae bacterium]|nr:enoyl-CoA hydratase/isomerase family protein [Nevskiaceae bacterium]